MELKDLAKRAATIYIEDPKVDAVLLGGSVARGLHDEFSDIELFIFWKEAPADKDRKEPIARLAGKLFDFHRYEDEEWAETYTVENIKLEISSFLSSTVQQYIADVTLKFDTDLDKQVLLATMQDGVPLEGIKPILKLKQQIEQYPKGLAEAMIQENKELGSRWQNREALVARRDWLMLYQTFVAVEIKLMGILFALNGEYVHHPAFKWQNHALGKMSILPENSSERFASVLLGDPQESVKVLEEMVSEIFQLARSNYPDAIRPGVMEKALWTRPRNN
ncbi:putative nucleotidyltransferase [Planomicrobium sp. HSC-17F08]|nr:putative nucleotidyltransferase [Planomicrobium sp. HSC-17F08]